MSKAVIIDQREIQRLGGVCARFPVSCLIRQLLDEAGLLKPFSKIKVLDLTYGEGRFWPALPQAEVWGFDVQRLRWVRQPQRFYQKSCEHWKKLVADQDFDLVVADPPFIAYKRGWEMRKHYYLTAAIPTILNEARKAARHFNAYLLVHFMWRAQPFGFEIITEAWFSGWGRYAKVNVPSWFGVMKYTP